MEKIMKNNGIFYIVISLLAILSVGTGVYAYAVSQSLNVAGDYNYYESDSQDEPDEMIVGAFSGPDIYSDINIYGSLTYGSSMTYSTTTRDTSNTFSYNDLYKYQTWEVLNMTEASSLTFTMPATSTMMLLLPKVGSTRTWQIHNSTTTGDGAATITLAAGAGMELVGVDSNADVFAAETWLEMTCTQKTYVDSINENIVCMLEEMIATD